MSEDVTYSSYLRLGQILDAQTPPGRDLAHHDELLFIITHQAYELWFKQVLHELTRARDLLVAEPVPEHYIPRCCKSLRRVHEIQKVMLSQISVIETMAPGDFLAFRDLLGHASGFQSWQFRELEILAGLPDEQRYQYEGKSFENFFDPEIVARFEARRAEPHLRHALETWLSRTPIEQDFTARYLEAVGRYVDEQSAFHAGNERAVSQLEQYRKSAHEFLTGDHAALHAACVFITAYREEPLLHWPNRLLDSMLEFEELWRLWRFRHARMVERMIGLRVGTGGSSGVDYLDATAGERYRIFGVILRSRSFLVPRRLLPDLADPRRYGFTADA